MRRTTPLGLTSLLCRLRPVTALVMSLRPLGSGTLSLFRFRNSGLLRDFAPTDDFGIDEAFQFLGRRTADWNHAEVDHLPLDFGHLGYVLEFHVKRGHDLLRRFGRRDDHDPARRIETGNAGFRNRRDVRCRWPPAPRGH